MMNSVQLKALNEVLEYLIHDEGRDFIVNDGPENHIYRELITLKEYYDEQTKEQESTEERGGHDQGDGCYDYANPVNYKEERSRGGGQSKGGTEED